MGGLRSKGFGVCILNKVKVLDAEKRTEGILKVRIPLGEIGNFSIRLKEKPVYGYLFKPVPNTFTGNYIISLFEGSEVEAPDFLINPKS